MILAASPYHFRRFVREVRGSYYWEPKYLTSIEKAHGYWVDTPVLLLEGFAENPLYTVELMSFIGNRFNGIGIVTEAEIYEKIRQNTLCRTCGVTDITVSTSLGPICTPCLERIYREMSALHEGGKK